MNWNHLVWDSTQKSIQRTGWHHDDFVIVGSYGDKHWAEKIISTLSGKDEILACREGHRTIALAIITNQELGDNVDKWRDWWSANKDKKQEEWIKDGFEKKVGLVLSDTLQKSDIDALLIIIGDSEIPYSLRWNAFRWLRDSGFETDSYNYADFPSNDENKVLSGLKEYCKWIVKMPRSDSPLVLDLGVDDPDSQIRGPFIFQQESIIVIYGLIVATFLGGLFFGRKLWAPWFRKML